MSTDAFSNLEYIRNYVDSRIAKTQLASRAVVMDIMRDGKSVRVKPIPEGKFDAGGHVVRYMFAVAGDGCQLGGMPPVGSEVLVIFVNNEGGDKWENAIAMGGLFNSKNNKSPDKANTDENAKKDRQYMAIQAKKDGSKMEIYDKTLNHYAEQDYIELVENGKKVIKVAGGSDDKMIHLGEDDLSDDNYLVTKKHLDKYDQLCSELASFVSNLSTMMALGDLGVPLPFVGRNSTYGTFGLGDFFGKLNGNLKENSTNKTSKVKGK